VDGLVETWKTAWDTPDVVAMAFPSRANDPEFIQFGAKYLRAFATPKNAAAQIRYISESLDAREALPLIQMPTLVLHSKDNLPYSIEQGRYLADHIDGARFVELPGGDLYIASSASGAARKSL
jgi:pimeloyl-ACP methyl ester carboxylesterase